jgi:hypothetical protein
MSTNSLANTTSPEYTKYMPALLLIPKIFAWYFLPWFKVICESAQRITPSLHLNPAAMVMALGVLHRFGFGGYGGF